MSHWDRSCQQQQSGVGVVVAVEPAPVETGDLGLLVGGPIVGSGELLARARQFLVFFIRQMVYDLPELLGDRLGAFGGNARLEDGLLDARKDLQEGVYWILLEALVGLIDDLDHTVQRATVDPAPLRSRYFGDIPVVFGIFFTGDLSMEGILFGALRLEGMPMGGENQGVLTEPDEAGIVLMGLHDKKAILLIGRDAKLLGEFGALGSLLILRYDFVVEVDIPVFRHGRGNTQEPQSILGVGQLSGTPTSGRPRRDDHQFAL